MVTKVKFLCFAARSFKRGDSWINYPLTKMAVETEFCFFAMQSVIFDAVRNLISHQQ